MSEKQNNSHKLKMTLVCTHEGENLQATDLSLLYQSFLILHSPLGFVTQEAVCGCGALHRL